MEPEEHERFYPSVAKAMTDRILGEELSGQTYDEEEAKIWGLNISDKVREAIYGNCTAQMPVTKLAIVLWNVLINTWHNDMLLPTQLI
jgi:hypothetical protein